MGKVKSAIITALLVVAIIVLTLFATISCNVPGTNGVKRYNSFLSSIYLGGDLTGEAYTVLYPDGVLSAADYLEVVNDSENSKKEDYEDKYVSYKGVYVEKDKLENGVKNAEGEVVSFIDSVKADAKVLSDRFGQKGYSSYSVTVEDDYTIKISVPTNFTYAAYKEYNSTDRSSALSEVSNVISILTLSGGLSLRDGDHYEHSDSLVSIRDDVTEFFKSASLYGIGGTYAVRIKLSDLGFETINKILLNSDSTIYIYVGETNLSLTISAGTALESDVIYYSSTKTNAQNFAIILDSAISNKTLINDYSDSANSTDMQMVPATSTFGENAAVYLAVFVLLVLVAVIVWSVIKYKKLGLVNALMAWCYVLVIITAALLLGIQVTLAGVFTALVGLAALCFTNFFVFEAVRKEVALGRTIQAAVKTGYKKTLTGILDLFVVLIVASIILALVGVGELAACGLIFFVGSIASYVLYWFTRFMWYVISSPVRDKFGFCGFAREDIDDED